MRCARRKRQKSRKKVCKKKFYFFVSRQFFKFVFGKDNLFYSYQKCLERCRLNTRRFSLLLAEFSVTNLRISTTRTKIVDIRKKSRFTSQLLLLASTWSTIMRMKKNNQFFAKPKKRPASEQLQFDSKCPNLQPSTPTQQLMLNFSKFFYFSSINVSI